MKDYVPGNIYRVVFISLNESTYMIHCCIYFLFDHFITNHNITNLMEYFMIQIFSAIPIGIYFRRADFVSLLFEINELMRGT